MKNKAGFWLIFCILNFPMAAMAVGNSDRPGQLNSPGQRIITGTIETISNDNISVKTDDGRTSNHPIDSSEQAEYAGKGLKKGDRIILSFNHRNNIVGIDKIDEVIPYNKDLWPTGNTRIRSH